MAATPTAKVDTPHKHYGTYAAKWQRCRDASDGQDKIHAKGETYLPKLKDQAPADYDAYRKRAVFYNATWRTLDALRGMLFRKDPQTALPAKVEGYASDIDMAGTSLMTFAREVALEVLEVGRFGILVDHPAAPAGVTAMSVAAAEAQGLRPTLQAYKAESIINWQYARVKNRWMLVQVRLKEEVSEPDGEWGETCVDQIRVLELVEGAYRQRLFRKADGEKGEWVQTDEITPTMNGAPLGFIPFYIVGPDGVDARLDEPPMIDLVDLNLAHYRVTADYEHGCHFTGLPTAVVSGYMPPDTASPLYIGSTAAWVFPDPNAKATFLEFTGQGLSALVSNLDRKEQQMAIIGARMLFAEKRQVEAAETAAIHRTGEASVLASIAMGVSEGIEQALTVFAQWCGVAGEVVYQLNRDFNPAMLDAQQLTALLKAVQAGQMSEQEFFDLMQRGDLIDSEQSFEAHKEQIGVVEPVRPVVPANDPGAQGAVA
ncbi:MAG: DUF4055 domain-containing protein [Novosphingobium sp.]|nr:DUF4055 domain-containing protein [Novosphingobium sp.]